MMKNSFHFILKALFVLDMFTFSSRLLWSCRKTVHILQYIYHNTISKEIKAARQWNLGIENVVEKLVPDPSIRIQN